MHFGERVAVERKRLGMSQAQAAVACGVSRGMWGRYERNDASMGSEVLSKFVEAGANANFLLAEDRGAPSSLTLTEAIVLEAYRNLSESSKETVEKVIAQLARLEDGG